MKILKFFGNSCLVETKMGHHTRMKDADTNHSIHAYIFIASCKKVRLEKRTGTATNTYESFYKS